MSGIGALCVGGPLGGQRKHILYGKSFWVVKRVPLPDDLGDGEGVPVATPITDTHVRYVAQEWPTEEGGVNFWVPEGQKPSETLALLLTAYEQQSINERKTNK